MRETRNSNAKMGDHPRIQLPQQPLHALGIVRVPRQGTDQRPLTIRWRRECPLDIELQGGLLPERRLRGRHDHVGCAQVRDR